MKILYFTNIPVPYRVDFFNEMGKYIDLTVVFEAETARQLNSQWFSQNFTNFKSFFLKKGGINEKAIMFGVLKYLKKNAYDIIIVSNYYLPTIILAIEKLQLCKIPFVYSTDGAFIKNENWLKKAFKSHLVKSATYWLSTGTITNAYYAHYGVKKDKIFWYPFTSLKESQILSNPLLKEEKVQIKVKLGIDEEKVVISVGQFIRRKGFDVLLEACSKLSRGYGVYIIGGGPTKEYLDLKEKYGLENVHFVGFKSKCELSEYYKIADLFVLPTREDIWGLVVNEAMAFGLPVITTDRCIAGLELIKDYENGFIVPVERADILANRIEEVLSDEQLAIRMGKASLKKIRPYTIENMARQHFNIFKKILNI